MVILENIDIDIDIDKAILQNIDIDKISNRFKFGISNRARAGGAVKKITLYLTHPQMTRFLLQESFSYNSRNLQFPINKYLLSSRRNLLALTFRIDLQRTKADRLHFPCNQSRHCTNRSW